MLMILPQSESYKILSARLQACSALHAHLNFSYALSAAPETARRSAIDKTLDKSFTGKKATMPAERISQGGEESTAELVEYFTKKVYVNSNQKEAYKG